jgi:hypothetical protein
LANLTKPVDDIEESLLASATYDGDKRKAILKFYDQKAGRFWLWQDNTGHRPYCVRGDTMMLGDNKPIADIGSGDCVLGLSGEIRVEGKSDRPYVGEMVRVHACGLLPFDITPEHPVLTASPKLVQSAYTGFNEQCWKQSGDLRPKMSNKYRDYLVMPIPKPRSDTRVVQLGPFSKTRNGWLKVEEFPLNEATAWLVGMYAAEGSPGGRRGAVFTLNKGEMTLQQKIHDVVRSIGYSSWESDSQANTVDVHVGGAVISRALADWCGRGASQKKIPDFILFHSDLGILKAFLDGYTQGDGSKGVSDRSRGRNQPQNMTSVSKLLVLQLQLAYARLGIFARIKLQHSEGEYYIEGRKVHQKEAYTVEFVRQPKYTWTKRVGDFFYVPITRIENVEFKGRVYNIQTSDNTYLVNNIVVHNCFTRLSMDELGSIRARKDVIDIKEEEKLDLLNDTKATLRKIITTDPLAVGGGNDSIRDIIRAWEADIKYYENYAYDRGLRMGTYYRIAKGKVMPVKHEVPERVSASLEEVTRRNPIEFQPYLKEWAELLSEPLCDFRRVAMDIEVANEAGRLPDTDDPKQPVIAVSFVTTGKGSSTS